MNKIDYEQTTTLSLKALAFLFGCVAAKSVNKPDVEAYEYATANWEEYITAAHRMTVERGDWLYDYVGQLVTDEEIIKAAAKDFNDG